jgi:hypothetical protein
VKEAKRGAGMEKKNRKSHQIQRKVEGIEDEKNMKEQAELHYGVPSSRAQIGLVREARAPGKIWICCGQALQFH